MTKLRRSFLIYLAVGLVLAFVAWQRHRHEPGAQAAQPRPVRIRPRPTARSRRRRCSTRTTRSTGKLADGTEYEVKFPEGYTEQITNKIVAADVASSTSTARRTARGWVSCSAGCPSSSLIGIVLFVLSRVQGGGRLMGFGKSRAKALNKDQPQTTFADVAGLDEAVEELQEIKEFLEAPAKFQEIGAKIPKGVLLFGPARNRQDAAGQGGGR